MSLKDRKGMDTAVARVEFGRSTPQARSACHGLNCLVFSGVTFASTRWSAFWAS